MQVEEVSALLRSALPGCKIEVTSDGSHFDITVVGEAFAGLRAVKKQQLVYAVLNEAIAAGAIHAVHMHLYTPEEFQALGD